MKIINQDIIFLSYDEPNAEKNYADLCSKVAWAKRVHGVEGSDAAHKACAAIMICSPTANRLLGLPCTLYREIFLN